MGWGMFFKMEECKAVLTLVWFIAYMDTMCDKNSVKLEEEIQLYCSLFYQVSQYLKSDTLKSIL